MLSTQNVRNVLSALSLAGVALLSACDGFDDPAEFDDTDALEPDLDLDEPPPSEADPGATAVAGYDSPDGPRPETNGFDCEKNTFIPHAHPGTDLIYTHEHGNDNFICGWNSHVWSTDPYNNPVLQSSTAGVTSDRVSAMTFCNGANVERSYTLNLYDSQNFANHIYSLHFSASPGACTTFDEAIHAVANDRIESFNLVYHYSPTEKFCDLYNGRTVRIADGDGNLMGEESNHTFWYSSGLGIPYEYTVSCNNHIGKQHFTLRNAQSGRYVNPWGGVLATSGLLYGSGYLQAVERANGKWAIQTVYGGYFSSVDHGIGIQTRYDSVQTPDLYSRSSLSLYIQ